MAVAKKAKPASGKSRDLKSAASKKTVSKPAPKKQPSKKPASRTAPSKNTSSPRKGVPANNGKKVKTEKKPLKPAGPGSKTKSAAPVKTPVKTTKTAAKSPVVSGKSVKSPAPAPAKSSSQKPTPAAKNPPQKKAAEVKQKENKAGAKPVVTPKAVVKAAVKSATEKPALKSTVAKPAKPSKPEIDPADAKAKKIMSELEDTMDLSKVKPRIKVPQPSKPVHRTPPAPPLKLHEPVNTNKVKFQLEFEFRSSPKILFNALSDSSGLAGWFADEVRTKDDHFTFVWEGGESYARLVGLKDMHLVRFQWDEDTDGTYFQFEIKQDELTGEIALVITDFALPGEKETNIRLWESQVHNLRMLLGSL